MAEVSLEDVSKTYARSITAVRDLTLRVGDGELMVLLGPSGCGKTTTLRLIAGLEQPDAGTIRIGGRVVNDVRPKDRDVAMVFQDYALYPHLSVRRNLALAIRFRGVRADEGECRDWRTGAEQVRLPKGHPDAGESLEQAALREVSEETGLTARVVAPMGDASYSYEHGEPRRRVEKRVHYFLMEHVSGEPHARDGEMQRVYWCPIEEAARRLSFDNERRAVEEASRRLSSSAGD